MPEFQVVFDSIYDYDLWLCNDLSYFLTLFSSFVAEKMLMSHTILKKTFISDCGREDASCQSLAGEEEGQRAQAADAKGQVGRGPGVKCERRRGCRQYESGPRDWRVCLDGEL